jgi:hypothetical protein
VDKIMALFASLPAEPDRWKPERGQKFYFVLYTAEIGYREWFGHDGDLDLWHFGNVWQTREEAEHARDKLKEVLVNFHKHGTGETQKRD